MRPWRGSEARVVPWPPSKDFEAKKCLGEGKNFASGAASGGKRGARWHWLPWGAGHALVRWEEWEVTWEETVGGP